MEPALQCTSTQRIGKMTHRGLFFRKNFKLHVCVRSSSCPHAKSLRHRTFVSTFIPLTTVSCNRWICSPGIRSWVVQVASPFPSAPCCTPAHLWVLVLRTNDSAPPRALPRQRQRPQVVWCSEGGGELPLNLTLASIKKCGVRWRASLWEQWDDDGKNVDVMMINNDIVVLSISTHTYLYIMSHT